MKIILALNRFLFVIIIIGKGFLVHGQNSPTSTVDSLEQVLNNIANDTVRLKKLVSMSSYYKFVNPGIAISSAREAIDLARILNLRREEVMANIYYAVAELSIGNYPKTLQLALDVITQFDEAEFTSPRSIAHSLIGRVYKSTNQYSLAISNFKKSIQLLSQIEDNGLIPIPAAQLAETYSRLNNKDSALYFCQFAEDNIIQKWVIEEINYEIGKVYENFGMPGMALKYYHGVFDTPNLENYYEVRAYLAIASLHTKLNNQDSALYYGNQALSVALQSEFYSNIIDTHNFLADYYRSIDLAMALMNAEAASQYKDSLSYMERMASMDNFVRFDAETRQRELDEVRKASRNRIRMNAFLGSSFTLIVVAILLFILFKRKQKANQKIELAYDQLKATQSQLIQSEKMASLGELTAGIAHEIQNPLNFVNNFSEISNELVEEVKSEKAKGKNERDEVLENELLNDISENLKKITHHGKRAEAIVKGMLLHSRTETGEKEPTDINALCDEYLRLSYHGLRAKDKSFNAEFKLEADKNLPKINVVPQDIGRVLLNLINNAFYAVDKKARSNTPQPHIGGAESSPNKYKPEVVVRTSSSKSPSGDLGVNITVTDNGEGIPSEIKDKIFQPFFTTKPTGSGTGLGLSLSYDIVKAHGGKIEVESEENRGTDFIITLPLKL